MKKSISLIILLGFLFGGVFASPSLTFAQSNTNISYGENADYEQALERLGSCTMSTWTPCILHLYYYIILYPSSYLVYLTGSIFDYFLEYSIDSDSYTGVNNEFVERGWSVIRDIANITFIFSLLYVAIMHILQADSGKTKKFLKDIIIAALLINFSLFFTKIVIDGGNILARAFYNNIAVENDNNTDYKTLSQGIASYVNPQSILTSKFFNPVLQQGRPPAPPSTSWIFFVLVLATIVNVVLALTFLSVFLLFAARVIGLWFMMIFSPLAFVSIAFPWGKGVLGRFSFSNWLKETVSLSFMAPVFLFFLFLLIMFLQIVYTSTIPPEGRTSIQNFMSVLIPFVAIILILGMAKKQAKEMAGQVGEQTTAWAGKLGSMAAIGTLGVTAFASRKVFGGLASSALKSGNYNERIAAAREKLKDENLTGLQRARIRANLETLKATRSTLRNAKKSSFDIRNADKSKMLWGGMGVAAGFLGKNIIKPAATAAGGDKMTFGKGSDQSRDKFEKAKQKKILEEASEESSVSFREKQKMLEDRDLALKEIKAITDGRKEISDSFDEQTKEITRRLDKLNSKPADQWTEDDVKESYELEENKNKIIADKEKSLKEYDDSNKTQIENAKEKLDIKARVTNEEEKRRSLFADAVESRNMWGLMMGVDNKEFADDIRSGKKSKGEEEQVLELIEKLQKKNGG